MVSSALVLISAFALNNNQPPEKESASELIAQYIRNENEDIDEIASRIIGRTIYEQSNRYNIDYRLVLAVMKVESNFDQRALSSKGARGLLQIKPSLARYIAEDIGVSWKGARTLYEPEHNIRIGLHLLSQLMEDFDSIQMALHAYHVGPTRLRKLVSQKERLNKTFTKAVLDEYRAIATFLPPQ